jgi:hypothetical protein
MTKATAKATDDDGLTRLLEQFCEADSETRSERASSEKCRDYYDGKQLTDNEIATLEKRRQDRRVAGP